jgi:hypothetical protein
MKRDKKKGPDGQEIEEDNSNLGGYGGGEGFE